MSAETRRNEPRANVLTTGKLSTTVKKHIEANTAAAIRPRQRLDGRRARQEEDISLRTQRDFLFEKEILRLNAVHENILRL
jgi:hypothetical protein